MHTNFFEVLMVILFSYPASPYKRYDQNDVAVGDAFTCPESLQQPPEIKIDGEWPGNGIMQSRQTLTLICTAPYPVYWEDIPTKTFLYGIYSAVSANPLHRNPNDFCYKEVVKILPRYNGYYSGGGSGGGYSRTGNFTCRSSVDSTISSSRFVYSKDNDRVFSCPAISVTHSRIVNGSDWLIPCPANLKDEFLNVTLSKMDDVYFNDSSLMYPSDDPSIHYDSRYGFLLKISHHSRPVGVYTCEATTVFDEVSSQESVDMRLQDYNAIPAKEYVTYVNGNQIIVTCESDEDITINIEHSYKLSLKSSTQRKPSAFNFSITYVLEETADPETGTTEGEISCRVINTNKILHTWKHDVSKICKASTSIIHRGGYVDPYSRNFYNDRTETYIRFENFDRRMTFTSSYCYNKAKCEMNLRDFSELDSAPYQESYYGFSMLVSYSGIIRCGVETNYSTIILVVQTLNETRLNPTNVTSEEKINITKLYDEGDEIFIGDEVPFACKVARYFYSMGTILWKFLYKNGTESLITPDNTTELDNNLYMTSAGYDLLQIKLSIRDSNTTGVACSALVWNSTIWESSVFKLDIKDRQIWDENATNQCVGGYQKPIIVLKRQRPMNDIHRQPYYDDFDRFNVYRKYRTSNLKRASHIVTDTDLLVTRRIFDYTLICVAKYPVKWTFEGISMENFYRGEGEKNENSGKGTIVNDILHHCFKATFSGQVYQSTDTGEFLCEKINDPKVNGSLYLFANLSPVSPIVNEGEHMTLYTDPKISQVYIPCRVTDPSVKLDLYYHEDHGMYKKLNNSSYVNYNPKKGFLMDMATVNFSSIYICATTNDTNSTSTVSFTFAPLPHATQEATSAVVATGKGSKRSLLVTNFVFLILLIIGIIGLQLWFLRKQFKFDVAMTRIFGSYINMEPELAPNEFHGNCHETGNTQLIPSFF